MHIAVCFWGLLRSLSFTIDDIRLHVLKPIETAGYSFDVFVHTYKFRRNYTNTRTKESGYNNFTEWKLLDPDYVYVEDQDIFDNSLNLSDYKINGDAWRDNYQSLTNHIRALHSLEHLSNVIDLLNSNANTVHRSHPKQDSGSGSGTYSNSNNLNNNNNNNNHYNGRQLHRMGNRTYDAVVFVRPDVLFLNDIPIHILPLYTSTSTLFFADFHRSCKGGELNDRFAMGPTKAALVYGRRLLAARNYSILNQMHSESYTYDFLSHMKVRIIEVPFRFRRVRLKGVVHDRDMYIKSPTDDRNIDKELSSYFYDILHFFGHKDESNVECSPHERLSLTKIQKMSVWSRSGSGSASNYTIMHHRRAAPFINGTSGIVGIDSEDAAIRAEYIIIKYDYNSFSTMYIKRSTFKIKHPSAFIQ